MIKKFRDATLDEIQKALEYADKASREFAKATLKDRAFFMRSIAAELNADKGELVETAMEETHLPKARLESEKARTIFQLTSYADACEKGNWMDISIDTADSQRTPPKPDLRKMMVPLGPVVVFGASNFPFAYSTAGGDTACAFAAGCPVVVKAHPAHAGTSELVAEKILRTAKNCNMPDGIFTHIHGTANDIGKFLVQHPVVKAVGFTGSFAGGKQLFDWGNQRKEPIPVFAEMGSVNPVFLLPQKLHDDYDHIAEMYAGSITLSSGQFCTNPGLIFGIESMDLDRFVEALASRIKKIAPAKMLHEGIALSYQNKKQKALEQPGVEEVATSEVNNHTNEGVPLIAMVTAEKFLSNPLLHQEVFGPFSLLIKCQSEAEMLSVSLVMEGQLTSTIMGTVRDIQENKDLVNSVKNKCGRFILNGVPTGVEVCQSMHHGGPFPATTDSRFTSVGSDGIRRFARPIAYQNWPEELLPDELKDANPLKIWRTVNTVMVAPSV